MQLSVLFRSINKLRFLLTRKQKWYLIILFILTIFLSIIETVGVSIIMPFISVASNPDLIDTGVYKKVFDFLGFVSKNYFVLAFGIAVICFYFFRAIYNVIYNYMLNNFSYGLYRKIAGNLFRVFINLPYKVYVQKNSGELLYIIGESANMSAMVLNVLQMFSELLVVTFLYSFMVAVDWQMTLVITLILLILLFVILRVLIEKSKIQGQRRSDESKKQSQILVETFGNYKFLKLKGTEEAILRTYNMSARIHARAQILNATLNAMPRNILESCGFSLLVGAVIYILWRYRSPAQVIPIISMYALALYRILPSINRLLGNINQIVYFQRPLDAVDEALHLQTERAGDGEISFEQSIRMENVSFQYMTGSDVLRDVSLEIRKGEKVAFTGESGGGKTTLADLLIGINKPASGIIRIDGVPLTDENIRSWRRKIGYIPQDIYLFDGTVGENVAFGAEYDTERLERVLRMANIWDFLVHKDGAATLVGEGGIQLSGGQKQRIGIARALYSDPDVLVLDEATSALDNDTEAKIMDEIYDVSHNKTLIVIAHRLSTVERCDRRIVVEAGRVESAGVHWDE
ncbi:MAG: ABC transporter ATP-binding protein [Spirochaetaceae bacterium]|nr:ABC transporter ATP-binding protein [Spirochaetaceae bacterium]